MSCSNRKYIYTENDKFSKRDFIIVLQNLHKNTLFKKSLSVTLTCKVNHKKQGNKQEDTIGRGREGTGMSLGDRVENTADKMDQEGKGEEGRDMGRLDRRRQTGEGFCLHFDQISIFQRVVWVALQGREVADTVID